MSETAYLSEINNNVKNIATNYELYGNQTAVHTEVTNMKLDDVIKLNYIIIFIITTFYFAEFIYKLLGGKR